MRLLFWGAWMGVWGLVGSMGHAMSIAEVINHMEQAEKKIKTVQFNFDQHIEFKTIQSTSRVKGTATFSQRGKMRIEKTEPDQQLMVSDGKKIWIYNPRHNQAWQGSVQTWVNSSILPQGVVPMKDYVGELKKNFDLSLESQQEQILNESVTVFAVPKSGQLDYRLTLVVSTENWFPSASIYESDSAVIRTEFDSVEPDLQVSVETFQFSVPKGAEIIHIN